jgi:hypothetical protein
MGDFRGPIEDLDGQREGLDAAIEKRADILFEARHARTLRSPRPVCHIPGPVSSFILAERVEACGMVSTGIKAQLSLSNPLTGRCRAGRRGSNGTGENEETVAAR